MSERILLLTISILFLTPLMPMAFAADPIIYENMRSGRQTVATAGTAVQLSSASVVTKKTVICAEDDNTGTIAVGSTNVSAALATRNGIYLLTADCAVISVNDLNKIYLDSTINGDGVTYAYFF